ncbi:SDR family oxidoreductase [Nocardia sp. NPDC003345]
MFLITAATGNVGRALVERLRAAGADVTALTRNPAAAGLPPGVDTVSALNGRFPLDGVATVFLNAAAVHGTAEQFLSQAVTHGVRRIVLLSSSSVLDDHPDNHTGIAHRELERRIEQTGLEWVFLRSGMFATNTVWWAPTIRADGVVRAAHAKARIAPIHEQDLAAAAAAAMLEDGLAGTAPVLTGPELISQAGQAELIGEALGRPIRFEEVSSAIGHQLLTEQHTPPHIADSLLRYYHRAILHPIEPTPISMILPSEQPRTYRQWIHDHRADFDAS